MQSLVVGLEHVEKESKDAYRTDLIAARKAKLVANGVESTGDQEGESNLDDRDIYDYNLTRDEIQKSLNLANARVAAAMKAAAVAVSTSCFDKLQISNWFMCISVRNQQSERSGFRL